MLHKLSGIMATQLPALLLTVLMVAIAMQVGCNSVVGFTNTNITVLFASCCR
jgi:hypothetical protein